MMHIVLKSKYVSLWKYDHVPGIKAFRNDRRTKYVMANGEKSLTLDTETKNQLRADIERINRDYDRYNLEEFKKQFIILKLKY